MTKEVADTLTIRADRARYRLAYMLLFQQYMTLSNQYEQLFKDYGKLYDQYARLLERGLEWRK